MSNSFTLRLSVSIITLLIFANCFSFTFNINAVQGDDAVKIMPLGNSITEGDGLGLGQPYVGYRQKLYQDLIGAGYNVDFVGSMSSGDFPEPEHEGHGGWLVKGIRDSVYNFLGPNPADIILLHIGTNDINLRTPQASEVAGILDEIDRYSEDVTVILARIILRNDDNETLRDLKNENTTAYNDAVEAMAQTRIAGGDKIIVVDMENALDYPGDMADQYHPNTGGYEKMATVWYNALIPIINQAPVAAFSGSPTSGTEPLTVSFSDNSNSYDGIVSWEWDFGDGETSTDENPIHVYDQEGNYTVSLTVEELDGESDVETKLDYITVTAYKPPPPPPPPPNSSPVAEFNIRSSVNPAINETISFIDRSSDPDGIIVSLSWTFGDGTTSTTQNPTHKYQSTGTFAVILTVKDDDGAIGIQTKQITIYELTPPKTIDDYDKLWHNSDFTITLAATDDYSGVAETYYEINTGPTQQLSIVGQPRITTDGANNALEYWSVDNTGNEETHHTLLGIKLDKSAPTAVAGQDITVTEDAIMNFDGINSHDNIGPTDYTWTLLDGTIQKLGGANPQYIFHTPGVFNVNLTVTDAALNSASDTIMVTVLDITAPLANAGDDLVVNEGNIVTFDGSATIDNVGTVSYNWTFTDVIPQTLVGINSTYVFESAGVYQVTLTALDVEGNMGTDTVVVTVIDSTWPVADAGPDQIVVEDTLVYFDGSASSDNVGIIIYVWTLIESGEVKTLYGVNASYFFETPDVYVATLTVSDAKGYSSNDNVSVIVRDNTPPTIEVEDYESVVEDNPISFDASKSYDNTGIINYRWVFGDGTMENTSVPTIIHVYTEPGVYIAELLVTDKTGNFNGTSISIVVYRDTDGDLIADYLDDDDDGDGIPDEWEIRYELDPLDASNANLDSDGDGLSNLEEYQMESDPKVYDFSDFSLSIVLVVVVISSIFGFAIFCTRKFKK